MKHPQEEIMAYLDGEIHGADVSEHLNDCPECRDLADDLHGVSAALLDWEVEQPASEQMPDAVTAELYGKPAVEPARPARKPQRLWRWTAAFAGTAALAVVAIGLKHPVEQERAFLPAPAPAPQAESAQGKPQSTPMVARTAELDIVAKDFDKARTGMEDILRRHGGYVGQMHVSAAAGSGRTLDAALRVPAKDLEPVMAELKRLGTVASESQEGEEVTQQYIDLEARLTNARNTETRLTALLDQRTGKLTDVLAVEQEIDRVRGDIERMEAERKALAGRVDFATLNVKLEEEYKAQFQTAPQPLGGRLRNAAVDGFRTMLDGLTGTALLLLNVGPTLLLWIAILFFPARFVWRKLRSRLTLFNRG